MKRNGYNSYGGYPPQEPWGTQGGQYPQRGNSGRKKTLIIVIAAAAGVLVILGVIIMLLLTGVIGGDHGSGDTGAVAAAGDISDTEGTENDDDTEEADDYYRDNSEKVVSVTAVSESADIPDEGEVIRELNDRGFDDEEITYSYTMDGEYCGDTEAAEDSDDRSPMYITMYMSANNELWTVYVINGQVIAYPVSFNLESGLDHEVLVSESKSVTSYDGGTNQFYETIPKEDVVKVIVVDEIDSETLDRLTAEEISREN